MCSQIHKKISGLHVPKMNKFFKYMERFRERDLTIGAKRTRGGQVTIDAKLDKTGKMFAKYPRKSLG